MTEPNITKPENPIPNADSSEPIIEKIKQDLVFTEEERAKLIEENEGLNDEIKELNQICDDYDIQLNSLTEERDLAIKERDDAKIEIEKITKAKAKMENDLNNELKSMEEEVNNLTKKFEESEEKNNSLEKKLEDTQIVNTETGKKLEESQNNLKKMKKEFEASQNENKELKKELKQLTEEKKKTSQKLHSYSKTLMNLKTQIKDLLTMKVNLKKELMQNAAENKNLLTEEKGKLISSIKKGFKDLIMRTKKVIRKNAQEMFKKCKADNKDVMVKFEKSFNSLSSFNDSLKGKLELLVIKNRSLSEKLEIAHKKAEPLKAINKYIGQTLNWENSKLNDSFVNLNELVGALVTKYKEISSNEANMHQQNEFLVKQNERISQHLKLIETCFIKGIEINSSLDSNIDSQADLMRSPEDSKEDFVSKNIMSIYFTSLIAKTKDINKVILKHIEGIKNLKMGNEETIARIKAEVEEKFEKSINALINKKEEMKRCEKNWEKIALNITEEICKFLREGYSKYQKIWNDSEHGYEAMIKKMCLQKKMLEQDKARELMSKRVDLYKGTLAGIIVSLFALLLYHFLWGSYSGKFR